MRRLARAAAVVLALAVAACGDDGGGPGLSLADGGNGPGLDGADGAAAGDADAAGPADTAPADTAAPDTQAPDAANDTAPADAVAPDTQADTAAPDTAAPDTQADTAIADTAAPDTQADTGAGADVPPTPDTAPADTQVADTGPADTGPPPDTCTPSCAGKQCGPDGCGGTCGACPGCDGPDPSLCKAGGQCASVCCPLCLPGQQCGSDGCGGACGTCGPGQVCTAGQCAGDPCDPNPCQSPPPASCDGSVAVTYEVPGTCGPGGSPGPVCTWTPVETVCSVDEVCAGGLCLPKEDPGTYEPAAAATVLTSLQVAGEGCCVDLTGDQVPDNGLGAILDSLSGLVGDLTFNEAIADLVTSGALAIVLEEVGLDGAASDPSLELNGFQTYDAAPPYADNLAGTGSFLIQPASFVPGTATPAIRFPAASIASGVLSASGGLFTVALPLGGVAVSLPIDKAALSAKVSVGPNGTGLAMANGTLGGAVRMEVLVEAANHALDGCTCLGLGASSAFVLASEGNVDCSSAFQASDGGTCGGGDPALCGAIGSVGTSLVCFGLDIFFAADVDTDGNGVEDAVSVGMTFGGTSATLAGVGVDQAVPGGCAGGGPAGEGGPLAAALALLLGGAALRRRAARRASAAGA